MDEERQRRVAENESFFREVNERIEESARSGGEERQAFVCQCGTLRCSERIGLALSDYERLRSNPLWFAVVPGHEIPEVERVIDTHEDYLVIEKIETGAEVAAERDARS